MQATSRNSKRKKKQKDRFQARNSIRTQLCEQAASNSSTSFAHFCRAFLSSLIPSRISFLSKQAKNKSRPSQQRARLVRSGAMRPPSEASFFFDSPEDQGNQPILEE